MYFLFILFGNGLWIVLRVVIAYFLGEEIGKRQNRLRLGYWIEILESLAFRIKAGVAHGFFSVKY
jgi:hypothetical protein